MRLDLGIVKHTHASFISDETSPNPSLGMAWSSTLEYLPRALNRDKHYRVSIGGVAKGTYTGASLLKDGFRISLDEEYRACVVEFDQHSCLTFVGIVGWFLPEYQ